MECLKTDLFLLHIYTAFFFFFFFAFKMAVNRFEKLSLIKPIGYNKLNNFYSLTSLLRPFLSEVSSYLQIVCNTFQRKYYQNFNFKTQRFGFALTPLEIS